MNHNKKIDKMKKFINAYGEITQEYFLPPDNYYKKGSFCAVFSSEQLDLTCNLNDETKYKVYKEIIEEIKRQIKRSEKNE